MNENKEGVPDRTKKTPVTRHQSPSPVPDGEKTGARTRVWTVYTCSHSNTTAIHPGARHSCTSRGRTRRHGHWTSSCYGSSP